MRNQTGLKDRLSPVHHVSHHPNDVETGERMVRWYIWWKSISCLWLCPKARFKYTHNLVDVRYVQCWFLEPSIFQRLHLVFLSTELSSKRENSSGRTTCVRTVQKYSSARHRYQVTTAYIWFLFKSFLIFLCINWLTCMEIVPIEKCTNANDSCSDRLALGVCI